MALKDWVETESPARRGGQGEVRKVRRASDGQVGALKTLHAEAAVRKERRYRMMAEVGGLRLLDGNGVPRVLDANEAEWMNDGGELFLVMDFIEGPTMDELVRRSPPSLDDALRCLKRILGILEAGHALPLHHRDLKPDNVIIRCGDWSDPVLIDLGIAWDGREGREFDTPAGQELGNRFLRLPEFAPGGDHHDARSDLAMAAGLLFFMLSGRVPRLPIDQHGRHPHQSEPNPIGLEIRDDHRWPALARVLTVAFQHEPRARHRDAAEMRRQLDALDTEPQALADDLDQEIARLRDLTSTAEARALERARPAMAAANTELYSDFSILLGHAGLMHVGQGPTFKQGGTTNEFYCVISRLDLPDPSIVFRHIVMHADGRFLANWHIDGGPAGDGYFEGPAADAEALVSACKGHARMMASIAVRAFADCLTRAAP